MPAAGPAGALVRIGLLGRGIGSSLSPIMHETEGRRLGLDYNYDLIDFDRLNLEDIDLDAVLAEAQAQGYAGVNVTYPFKQAVLVLLDGLSPEAAAIGAVNTVVFRDGVRTGHNTDCWGFAESFRRGLPSASLSRVLQIGAGGAGVAVARALVQLGVGEINIVDADQAKASSLAAQLVEESVAATALPPDALPEILARVDGVVNATPVGMEKYPGTPFDPALLAGHQWVADIIYFPRRTHLLQQAAELGCPTLPGGGMAIYQAVRAFQLFTGLEPDPAEMGRTFAAHA
ncbi:shikimate dehydrogenase [Devosia sp. FJ2-5-3]|uniref:shikimate dehydrogenase n=1 Tax=Devosia sp. FJ2-5-3 TaxID=2976680 RepID=UPI0023D7F5E1|nr:shikimate dehydrogenase [Devosia sp. FJ2-5-3]WEJ60499.1 shikimate dehydrogenase [Devosia sp. FJ2-5-3]